MGRLKEWLEQNFYIPKHTKIPERTLLIRVGLSVGMIVLCLFAMSFSAFAFFSHGVTSAPTALISATYELDATSAQASGNNGYFLLENTSDDSIDYTFTLSVSEDTTATVGYCKIAIQTDFVADGLVTLSDGTVAENVQIFYTAPLWKTAAEGKPSSREVTLTLPAGKTLGIRFLAEWGSCASTDVVTDVIDGIQFASVTPPDNSGAGEPPADETPSEETPTDNAPQPVVSEPTADETPADPTEEPDESDEPSTPITDTPAESDITE